MRNTYGKLIYLLQDSQSPEIKEMLEFNTLIPIKTVYLVLEKHDRLQILTDDLILTATMEITSIGKQRRQIQAEIKQKERAIEALAKKYKTNSLSQDEIKQCLYSIGDNHAFLRTNRDPCDRLLTFLKQNINPNQPTPETNLSIQAGRNGARLSHSHSKQYSYCKSSLIKACNP